MNSLSGENTEEPLPIVEAAGDEDRGNDPKTKLSIRRMKKIETEKIGRVNPTKPRSLEIV